MLLQHHPVISRAAVATAGKSHTSASAMPTIAVQVGQCGNQLGAAFWELLGQQQAHCRSSLLPQEWFATSLPHAERLMDPTGGQNACIKAHIPRCICVDSESKVVKHWEGQQRPTAVHMLGRGGGCGNNW